MPLCVRPADADDAGAFADIHVRGWQAAYPGFVPQSLLDTLDVNEKARTWRTMLTDPVREGHQIVCEHDDQIVGWCTYGTFRQDDMFPSLDATARADVASGAGEIQGMYVDPNFWGVGAGSLLLTQALRDLDVLYPVSYLWVFDGNARAQTCYARAGFTKHLTSVNSKPGMAPRNLMRRDRP